MQRNGDGGKAGCPAEHLDSFQSPEMTGGIDDVTSRIELAEQLQGKILTSKWRFAP